MRSARSSSRPHVSTRHLVRHRLSLPGRRPTRRAPARGQPRLHVHEQSPVGLGLAAIAQTVVFIASGSIALLADLIHNFGDALTALPLGIAFTLHSQVAERRSGLAVIVAIFTSACVAGAEAVQRLTHHSAPTHLAILAFAGAIGYAGNWAAAKVRTRAGHRLGSPALIADGEHARADAYLSLAVVASAAVTP
jgi:divalent metal cation (Fe/Co/Zn/Cd) transporter